MRTAPVSVTAILSAAALVGCGSSNSNSGAAAELPNVASCSDAWRPFPEQTADIPPTALAYGSGVVVFEPTIVSTAAEIEALSTTDGSISAVATGWAENLWIEGDEVLYTQNDRLFRVPIAGGTSALVLDGGPLLEGDNGSLSQALDPSYFYWTDDGGGTWSVWRMARQGGVPQKLGAMDSVAPADLFPSSDAVIVTSQGYPSYAVPYDGTPIRSLAFRVGASSAGADGTGTYSYDAHFDAKHETFDLMRSPADGGKRRPFWPSKPPSVRPTHVWSDGDGGWLVTGLDLFDDGGTHGEVWLLDADETGRLAACDPRASFTPTHPMQDSTARLRGRPAFSPDAAYVVADYSGRSPGAWTIVKIPR